jgi:chloramphenicol 3-O phosphotransferase
MSDALSAVIITGPSSSGKTAAALELRSRLPDVWLHVPIDVFFAMVDMNHPRLATKPMTTLASLGFFRGVTAAWKGLIEHGNRLIIDVVANKPLLDDCARVFRGERVMLVRLTCSPTELDERERGRGDRPIGMARQQSEYLENHLTGAEDALVDTSVRPIADVVDKLIRLIQAPPSPLALERWGL